MTHEGTLANAVVYGDPAATHVLDLFEDMRCSYSADVEHDLGAAITELADRGVLRVRYQVANFLDRGDAAGPSTCALAALGWAARQGIQEFRALRSAILAYRRQNGSAGLANQDTLIEIAKRAPVLHLEALRADLAANTYRPWAVEAGAASLAALKVAWAAAEVEGQAGVPTAFVDGTFVELFTPDDKPISPSEFAAEVEAILSR
ncbi:thioredoxin domain-containing protein [Actinospica robiniae]|uniref:thioredoxin domain-containing protein n=1 Tax=Actinospica robiniae TaxID=304901 RepID=UPI000418FCDF|nr:thioredoxin domain-containing protein [Actinospica robiniae]